MNSDAPKDGRAAAPAASRLTRAFLWSCDKIVTGTVEAVKRIPAIDRRLTAWTRELLKVMFRRKWLSLIALVFVPAFAFLFLEADGVFEPLFDAFDALTEIIGVIPFDILALTTLSGSGLAVAVVKIKDKIPWKQAAGTVFYAVAARAVYLTLILILVMALLQAPSFLKRG